MSLPLLAAPNGGDAPDIGVTTNATQVNNAHVRYSEHKFAALR
jgi:hypothetical protein